MLTVVGTIKRWRKIFSLAIDYCSYTKLWNKWIFGLIREPNKKLFELVSSAFGKRKIFNFLLIGKAKGNRHLKFSNRNHFFVFFVNFKYFYRELSQRIQAFVESDIFLCVHERSLLMNWKLGYEFQKFSTFDFAYLHSYTLLSQWLEVKPEVLKSVRLIFVRISQILMLEGLSYSEEQNKFIYYWFHKFQGNNVYVSQKCKKFYQNQHFQQHSPKWMVKKKPTMKIYFHFSWN